MNERQAVLVIIAIGTIVRLALGASTGLGVDESYMASNARDLSLSYFDHPPLHVWIAGIAARLAGNENDIVLRLPFIALFAGSTWLLYRLTARVFDERSGLWAAGLFNLAPVFGLAGGVWILPEGPVDFFMLAGSVVLLRLLPADAEPRRPLALWLAAGLLGGFALLSKYQGVFLFLSTFVFLLTVPRGRRMLATPGPWLGAAVALLILTPVIAWNVQHDFASFRFQSGRISSTGLNVTRLLQSLGEQAAYLGVWNVAPLLAGLYQAFRKAPAGGATWFLALLAIGPIAVFTLATLWSPGLPHWTAQGWLFAMPLAGAVAARWSPRVPRFMAYSMIGATAAVAVFLVVAVSQTLTGWATRLLPAGWNDVTRDLVNWTELRTELQARGLLGATAIAAAPHWIQAGKASYALGPGVEVLCLCERPQHFAYRYSLADFAGADVVLVEQRDGPGSAADLRPYFRSIEPTEPPVAIHRAGGDPALLLDIFVGRGFIPPK